MWPSIWQMCSFPSQSRRTRNCSYLHDIDNSTYLLGITYSPSCQEYWLLMAYSWVSPRPCPSLKGPVLWKRSTLPCGQPISSDWSLQWYKDHLNYLDSEHLWRALLVELAKLWCNCTAVQLLPLFNSDSLTTLKILFLRSLPNKSCVCKSVSLRICFPWKPFHNKHWTTCMTPRCCLFLSSACSSV